MFQELSADQDMKYYIEEGHVHILTKHFTKFIVSKTDTRREFTDALLTIAASHVQTSGKGIIQLRLMLDTHPARLNDFSHERKKVITHCTFHNRLEAGVINHIRIHYLSHSSLSACVHFVG